MTPAYRLAVIQRRADQAAQRLNPLLATGDAGDLAKLAHDVLNDLAAIRLQAGLIELEAPTT